MQEWNGEWDGGSDEPYVGYGNEVDGLLRLVGSLFCAVLAFDNAEMDAVVVAGPAFVWARADIDCEGLRENATAAARVADDEFGEKVLPERRESSRPIQLDLAIFDRLFARPNEIEPLPFEMEDCLLHIEG